MQPADLETLATRELRRLQGPRAPRTLLPRIMAAIETPDQRPWYARAWLTWPAGWQIASSLVLATLLGGGVLLIPQAEAAFSAAFGSSPAADAVTQVSDTADRMRVAMTAVRIVWRTLLEPIVGYVFAVALVMCLACAAFAIALNRVVLGKAFQR